MKKYADLIDQTFELPSQEFSVEGRSLSFNGISLIDIIKEYGTPLRLTYLPKISEKIELANQWFSNSMKKYKYQGDYTYCYCTKSNHFSHVLDKVLEKGSQIETSSAFDIAIIKNLYAQGKVGKDLMIICNGFKRPVYTQYISGLINEGFDNCIPILDNLNELAEYEKTIDKPYKVGIRVAADEEPNFEFYTSRLGIRYHDINKLYEEQIKPSKAMLKMLHFFINTGIRDTAYYWSELSRFMYKYCELKKICPDLDTVDIGGGFPFKSSLSFEYDYQYMTDQIIENIKWICDKNNVPVPNIITEFGSFTVSESGAFIYSILDQKLQNDKELWYMIDGSFITHMPDTWALNQKYILLAVNKWDHMFQKVNIGGLTCDSKDYYNSEAHATEVFLPLIEEDENLYIGFFHTVLIRKLWVDMVVFNTVIPAPKHVLIDKDEEGNVTTSLFKEEQNEEAMLKILGY